MGANIDRLSARSLTALALSLVLASGCLSKSGDSDNAITGPDPDPGPGPGNAAPVITGTPPVSATVGQNYSFTPTASDADGDPLTFQVENQPAWASFDTDTGALTGVPQLGSVGMHNQVRITVSDGLDQSSLPRFDIEVAGGEVATDFAVQGTQPTVETPADVGTVIRITFNSTVDPNSVTGSSVTVSDRDGAIAGNLEVVSNTLVFTPDVALATGMFHNASVASSVRNTDGDSLGAAFAWSFTTGYGDAVPELAALEETMLDQGVRWGDYMDPSGPNPQSDKFFHEFYSAANSFQRISDHLGTAEPWLTYADWSNEVFRTYLISTGYATQGLRRFTHGMYGELVRGDNVTLEELQMLRDNPAYSRITELRTSGGAEHRSRPVALAVMSNVHAERAGDTRMMENGAPRLESFIRFMGSHLYEWRTGDYRGEPDVGVPRFAPFMFGLTAHSLINYIEWERTNGRDENQYWVGNYPIDYGQGVTPGAEPVSWPTIIDAIEDVATWAVLEAHHDTSVNTPMWNPDNDGYASFIYQTSGNPNVRAGLNLMIAPTYAWLWKETGDRRYRDWADQLFGAGALNSLSAARNGGKQFNQQFIFSFDYMQWRAEGDERWLNQ